MDLSKIQMCVEKTTHTTDTKGDNRLLASFFKAKQWKNGSVITIGFLPVDTKKQQALFTSIELMKKHGEIDSIEYEIRKMKKDEAVKYVIQKRLQPLVGLKFNFIDDYKKAMVRISFVAGNGSYSELGTDCLNIKDVEKETMNLAWVDSCVILHEFGHVCGLVHEHSVSKQNTIEWNKPALYEWAKKTLNWDKEKVDENIIKRYKSSQLNGSDFDPKSIMLYFYPAILTTNHKGTSMNQILSPLDKEWLSKVYPPGKNNLSLVKRNKNDMSTGAKVLFVIFIILIILGVIGRMWIYY
jgi:hypothetical protein